MNVRLVAGALIVALVVTAGIAFGIRAFKDNAEPPELKGRFANDAISFDYPATWQRETYTKESSFSSGIVFLATAEMHEPCVETTTARRKHTSCGWPVDELEPGGVVIEWSSDGWLGGPVDGTGRGGTTIAGRPANVSEIAPGSTCEHLGSEIAIYAEIARDVGGSNWYQMSACLRGPGRDQLRREVYAMLASLEIHEPLIGAEGTE